MEPIRTIEVGDYVEIQLEKDGPKIYEAKVLKKAVSQRQTLHSWVYTTDITAKDRKGKIHTTDSYALHGRLRRVGRKYHRKRERIAVVLIFGLSVKSSSLCRLNDMGTARLDCYDEFLWRQTKDTYVRVSNSGRTL